MGSNGFIRMSLHKTQSLFSILNSLIWPPMCQACGCSIDNPEDALCRDCWQAFSEATAKYYCKRCGSDLSRFAAVGGDCDFCRKQQFNLDRFARVGSYQGCLRDMILQLKFSGRSELALTLAGFLNASVVGEFSGYNIDIVMPVPVHWTRRISRGWNQSLLIAKAIKFDNAEIDTSLIRTKRTRPQPGLNFPQRRKNVKNAFAITKGREFKGKTVCLVDDVRTSGATLNECARVLRDAGAAKVLALVVATAGGSSGEKTGSGLNFWEIAVA